MGVTLLDIGTLPFSLTTIRTFHFSRVKFCLFQVHFCLKFLLDQIGRKGVTLLDIGAFPFSLAILETFYFSRLKCCLFQMHLYFRFLLDQIVRKGVTLLDIGALPFRLQQLNFYIQHYDHHYLRPRS